MTNAFRQSAAHNGHEKPSTGPRIAIRARSSVLTLGYMDLWRNRDLLWLFLVRDFKLRYRQTLLGGIWVVLGPLLGAAAFAFVFGSVAKLPSEGVPYFVFAFAGLIGWNLFSSGLTKAGSSLVDNSALISKVYFPRLLLPVASVMSGLVDVAVGFLLLLVLIAANGVPITMAIVLAPAWIALLGTMALGIGLLLAALMVSFRDVRFGIPILVQVLLYVTPVVYPSSAVPESARALLQLNPLSGAVEGARWSLIGTPGPSPGRLLYSMVAAGAFLLLGTIAFRGMERKFADVI